MMINDYYDDFDCFCLGDEYELVVIVRDVVMFVGDEDMRMCAYIDDAHDDEHDYDVRRELVMMMAAMTTMFGQGL
jgi:hypothetical protein